jgi:hypothetical protein
VATRFALALIIMLAGAGPVSARTVDVVVHTSSPTVVTAGYPVAYPVTAQNVGKNTLNSVVLSGVAPDTFDYLGASSEACSADEPVCVFGFVPSGASLPDVAFYYLVAPDPGAYTFRAVVSVNEGSGDNSDDQSVAADSFSSAPVETNVVEFSNDFVSGYSLADVQQNFSTGLNLDAENQHGSSVTVPSNAEVRVADVPPLEIDVPCPTVAASCFGWATSLDIGDGMQFPAGIEVTIQWDASQLPPGMTDRKLQIVHFDEDTYELVTESCTFGVGGLPTSLPCIKSAPQKQPDKDIQATILLLHNGFVRGW